MSWKSFTASESEHQVKSRLLLDVVVGQSAVVYQPRTSEDESLLIDGDAFLVMNFRLDVAD